MALQLYGFILEKCCADPILPSASDYCLCIPAATGALTFPEECASIMQLPTKEDSSGNKLLTISGEATSDEGIREPCLFPMKCNRGKTKLASVMRTIAYSVTSGVIR